MRSLPVELKTKLGCTVGISTSLVYSSRKGTGKVLILGYFLGNGNGNDNDNDKDNDNDNDILNQYVYARHK